MRSAILLCCLVEAPADRRRLAAFNYMEVDKLTASDAAVGDNFGRSVAIDGATVVVGTRDAEAVYVFRTTDGGATYGQVAKLTASDAAGGVSVAIDGDTIVVGAYLAGTGGAVYIFRTSDGGATYGQVAKLTASDAAASDYFGSSVAIDGSTVVVGAYGDDSYTGSAYVFRTTDGGATYGEVAKLTAADAAAYDYFGKSVAIAGGTIVVGALDDDAGSWSGSAYVFRTTDDGATYGQVAKLTASDAAADDRFGISVAIDSDRVVVGAHQYWNGGQGAAYVFRTTDGGASYGQVAKLTASDAAADSFGWSVAIDGDRVVVGASDDTNYGGSGWGAAYVFRTTDGGATYNQVAKLTASDAASYDDFGRSVAIDGDRVVVGAYEDDDGGSNSGSAYVFDANAPTSQPTSHPTPRPSPRPTPRPSPQPTAQPTTAHPTAQPTKQVDDDDDVLAPWGIALISIAGLVFGVGCFVFLRTMRKSPLSATAWTRTNAFGAAAMAWMRTKAHGAAATAARISPAAPPAAETPPMLRTTSVLPMGTVESVHAPDADAAPPILGEVVTHSTVLSVSN